MTLQASPGTSRIWLHPVSLIRVAAALLAVSAISPSPMEAQQSVLVPAGAVWKYLDTGTDQGTAWRAPAFNDTGWKTGAAELGYGDGDEATLVGYGPNSSAKYTTTYFRHAFTVANPSAYGGLTLRVLRDDGAIVYLNGTEVFRTNMPTGSVTAATFASSVVLNANERTYVTAAINPARLVAGTNVLAVEIHQSDATSSDVSFNLELTTAGAVTVTRGPYLQLGTPSSTVVRWRTSAPVVGRVRYGQAVGAHTWAADESAASTEHAVALTGLLPNTTYYYAVGTATTILAGGDATHFFRTPPVAGTATPTRVWVLGDSGTANANARAVRDAYYAFTGTRHTNLWLMLGDNAYPNGTDAEYQAAVFDIFPTMLRKSVLWSTLGNHDGYTADSASQTGPYYNIFTLPKSAEAGGLASGTEAYYSFDYANIHFICLESFETNRSATGPMLTWLRNDLASTAQPWIIAFFHHPPYSKGSHDSDTELELREMRQNALPILENAGVDLVLSGHSHSYERSFLIDGHYGTSGTFTSALKKNGGSGRVDGTGAYRKPTYGMAAHEGAVYAVAGSSGQATGGTLNHPAMFLSLNSLGSLVLDVNGSRLDATFLDHAGVRRDYFTILKGAAATAPSAPSAPANLRTTGLTVSQIDLAWTDTASDESGFQLQRSADNVTFTTIATRGSNVTSYSDSGLNRNRRYYYRVRAFKSGSPALYSSFSNTLAATTLSGISPDDVALYAGQAPVRQGAWSVTADSTAAGGVRLYNRDAGLAKVVTPAANPVDYFELTFNAQAGRAYRLWMRGKALNNAYTNDSVWVQFSDSVDASNGAAWRIGSTSGIALSVEECSGCGLSAWGWHDSGWGVGVRGVPVYFATSGSHRIRVQRREDGISIDQIVLSPVTFFTSAPGATKNDTTILPTSAGVP